VRTTALKTTREHFGTALSSLARLYDAADRCGDWASAERYSAAVSLLLRAWPPDGEDDGDRRPRSTPVFTAWAPEQTLIGLGLVPQLSVVSAQA
jgi:hypothetical protein